MDQSEDWPTNFAALSTLMATVLAKGKNGAGIIRYDGHPNRYRRILERILATLLQNCPFAPLPDRIIEINRKKSRHLAPISGSSR